MALTLAHPISHSIYMYKRDKMQKINLVLCSYLIQLDASLALLSRWLDPPHNNLQHWISF